MAIEVTCPNGHQLKIKEKYAGQSGLCPRCKAQIWVSKPPIQEDEEFIDLVPRSRHADETMAPAMHSNSDDTSALAGDDDATGPAPGAAASAGESLLSSSIIRHHKVCPKCYQVAPIWYARCMNCDFYFNN